MNNGNPNTNSGGVTYIPAISTSALFVGGQRLRDIVTTLQSNISLNESQITQINAFLARLDLQITDPNVLTLTNENRNQVLKTLIDALNTKTNYLDTTALTQSWVLTDTNKKIMLSNADVSLVRENFTNEKYTTLSILCKRSINSKNPDAKAKEVIIKNY